MSQDSQQYVKVFIGRFQPFHNGHLKCLRAAIDTSSRVVVVIGSVNTPESLKNPWDGDEREAMIRFALRPAELDRVSFLRQGDLPGNDALWVKQVKTEVRKEARKWLPAGPIQYTLVGCHKGADTYYLKLYRGWGMDLIPSREAMNATDVRNAFFGYKSIDIWSRNLPSSSTMFLWHWKRTEPDTFTRFRLDMLAAERQRES